MAGRPTKYDPAMNVQVQKFACLGCTDAELSDFLNIDIATLNRWKIKYPEFRDALKKGKVIADAKVADSLYKRATGYQYKTVKIFNHDGKPLIVPYVESLPPDVTAAIFWLKNRRGRINPAEGQAWRDRQEIDITEGLSDEQIDELYDKIITQLKKQK